MSVRWVRSLAVSAAAGAAVAALAVPLAGVRIGFGRVPAHAERAAGAGRGHRSRTGARRHPRWTSSVTVAPAERRGGEGVHRRRARPGERAVPALPDPVGSSPRASACRPRSAVPSRASSPAAAWPSTPRPAPATSTACTGRPAQVGALFHTSIRSLPVPARPFLANNSAPVFPNGLGITNVVGLNTLQGYSTAGKAVRAQGSCLPGGLSCIDQCVPSIGCTGGTTPQDLWSVYEQPAAHTGAGQGLAVFGEGATDGVIERPARVRDALRPAPDAGHRAAPGR